jgi:hypothetical protein
MNQSRSPFGIIIWEQQRVGGLGAVVAKVVGQRSNRSLCWMSDRLGAQFMIRAQNITEIKISKISLRIVTTLNFQ